MADCSDLQDKYDKEKDKAERARDKADMAKDRYEDAEDDYEFESDRDCDLHGITLPDGTVVFDIQGQVQCLQERERARDRYRDKMDREKNRMDDAEHDAENAEGAAEEAKIEWCACEEQNRPDEGEPDMDFEDFPSSEPGDWNEPSWDDYVIA